MALATRRRPTTHQKKRQAGHHKHNRPYLKAYWPYLPMAAIVALGLFVNSWLAASSHVLGVGSDFSAQTLLQDTNQMRQAGHEADLSLSQQLAAAAQAKANDMVSHDYWSHTSPDGKTPWTFITASGYQYQSAGENLAYGFANAGGVINGWMNSTEHRANVLNAGYQNVGFGVAQASNYQGKGPAVVVVAEYAQPVAAAANISFNVDSTSENTAPQVHGEQTDLPVQTVSRVQLLTGSSLATIIVAALTGAAFAIFLVRHGLRLKRLALQGESYFTHHPLFDIAITLIFTAGFVLTRASGLIR